jgi:hypothetical protein
VSGTTFGQIVWYGDVESAEIGRRFFEPAGITMKPWEPGIVDGDSWAAVLFLPKDPAADWDELCRFVKTALDVGRNAILVRPAPNASFDPIRAIGSRLQRWGVKDGESEATLSELALRGGRISEVSLNVADLVQRVHQHRPTLTANPTLDITPQALVDDDTRVLLRYAFSDCLSVRLSKLGGGRAADNVFSIIASRGDGRPLPFVAKIGGRLDTVKEAHGFEYRIRDYVPFSNRPNILAQRSVVLGNQGILVGQFVERSAPIDVAVQRDGATAALEELFSSVLHRWWANSFIKGTHPQTTLGATRIQRWFDPSAHPDVEQRESRRRVLNGHRGLAEEIVNERLLPPAVIALRLTSTVHPLRQGGIHGDLNCGNVLVRGSAPLVIDFTHCADGPLLADPAWLEVNLVFNWEWRGNNDAETDQAKNEWKGLVACLYEPASLQGPLALHHGETLGNELHRLANAVRTIRRHALSVSASENDYLEIVAAALVRFASLEAIGRDAAAIQAAAHRAAYAYLIASNLVQGRSAEHMLLR